MPRTRSERASRAQQDHAAARKQPPPVVPPDEVCPPEGDEDREGAEVAERFEDVLRKEQ